VDLLKSNVPNVLQEVTFMSVFGPAASLPLILGTAFLPTSEVLGVAVGFEF